MAAWPSVVAGAEHARRADGSIYVAAYEDQAVRRVSPSGEVTTITSTPPSWGPTGIAVAADGAMWVLEASVTNAQRVRRIGRDGTVRVF
jgi:streptogramin lyase